ncbi:DUF4142 domain-containing protein [Streptomyces sp. NRRL F-5135]|uniref:DUF4142 domain-containing protein n=1 Tax=Streptomyces sp. NRRL F-5135 TaxID=1463858 RepID=UPI000D13ECFD|nr:DUF4142 domain-containing protein [Streptomyces sp. NRRL F-5135]
MRTNRRAEQSRISMRAVVALATAVVAAVAVTVFVQNDQGEASAGPVAANAPYQPNSDHDSGNAGHAASGRTDAAEGQAASGPQPVTEVDKTFLVAVRQAGLWEIPAGKLAQTQASSEQVKRAGLHLLDGHSKLDQLVREDARILGVDLPDEATPEQQEWVTNLENAKGAEFDRMFANVLRASHGKIFATIGEVRAATQNDLIRRHARQANQTVLDHMEVLEDTGLVDGSTLADVEKAVTPK